MTRRLSEEELEAVKAFAAAHGRRWKSVLTNTYWYYARVWRDRTGSQHHGSLLHALRNDPNWGHEGLHKFKLETT